MILLKDGLPGVSRSGVFLMGALLCLNTVCVRADEKSDTKAIKGVYETHTKAFRNKDAKAIFAGMTPDCKFVDKGNPYGLAQLKFAYSQQAPRIQVIKEYREDLSEFHIQGKKATVKVHTTFLGKVADPQGRVHDIEQTGGSIDTLVKTSAGAWKLKQSDIQFERALMDGKLVGGSR